MKNNGIVRRIDELGRIVIPKGIRNKLRIYEGDRLEININDNIIEIQKYNAFHNNFDVVTNILLALEKETKESFAIISEQKIFTTSLNVPHDIIVGEEVNNDLFNKLFELKIFEIDNHSILHQGRKHSFTLMPISYNSEILGGLIIFKLGISPEQIKIIQAFRNLITLILKV